MDKITDVFDWRVVLIDNYKKMGLDEEELSLIFVVNSFLQNNVKLITPDLLSLKMTLSFDKIDSIFTNLIKKKYLSFENKDKLEISIEPIIKKLLELFYEDYKKESVTINEKDQSDALVLFENEFGRALSQFEVSTIKEWFIKGSDLATIKEALNVAILAKVKTIRYIDKVLLEWKRRDEVSKNGQSALGGKWGKNIEETIEIAKINWMED